MSIIASKFTQGDTLEWIESHADYLASDGYTMKYRLSGPSQIDIESTADGADHSFTVAKIVTADYGAGIYKWQRYVTKDDKRYTLGYGQLEVLEDLTKTDTGAGYDQRSFAQKIVDALEAAIARRATREQQQMTIGGRQIQYMTMAEMRVELYKWKRILQNEQTADQLASGIERSGNIHVRFNSPS